MIYLHTNRKDDQTFCEKNIIHSNLSKHREVDSNHTAKKYLPRIIVKMSLKNVVRLFFTYTISLFWLPFACMHMVRWMFTRPGTFFKTRKLSPSCFQNEKFGQHQFIKTSDGVSLHCVLSGRQDKPLVVFVHGFPECWYSWREQIVEFQKDFRWVSFFSFLYLG